MKDNETSAPGLTQEDRNVIQGAADFLRLRGFNNYPEALEAILTRASAATVGEASGIEPMRYDALEQAASEARSHIESECKKIGVGKAAQQQAEPSDPNEIACSSCGLTMGENNALAAMKQAEPGADERSQQLAVFLRLAEVVQADSKRTRDRYPAQSERADQLAAFMKTACKWAAQSGQRAGVAEPEGWREFITEVAQQKPEKPDHWSPCGQCARNASRADDLLTAAPTQQEEENK